VQTPKQRFLVSYSAGVVLCETGASKKRTFGTVPEKYYTMPEAQLRFTGKMQPSVSRAPEIAAVNYAKGGDDFRCPSLRSTSSFGRQIQSGVPGKTEPRVPVTTAARFAKADTVGPGPATLRQYSSLRKQGDSRRKTAGTCSFGTSSRTSALRLYAVYTTKK